MTNGEAAIEVLRHDERFREIMVNMLLHIERDLVRKLDEAMPDPVAPLCTECEKKPAEVCNPCVELAIAES